jgi:hypothetical protein
VGAGGVNLVVSLVSLMTRSFQLRSHRWKIIFAGERIKIPKQARARFKSGHQGSKQASTLKLEKNILRTKNK